MVRPALGALLNLSGTEHTNATRIGEAEGCPAVVAARVQKIASNSLRGFKREQIRVLDIIRFIITFVVLVSERQRVSRCVLCVGEGDAEPPPRCRGAGAGLRRAAQPIQLPQQPRTYRGGARLRCAGATPCVMS